MKILMVCNNSIENIGGIQNYVKNITIRLTEKKHQIDFLSTKPLIKKMEVVKFSKNINIYYFPVFFSNYFFRFSPKLIMHFNKIKEKYDVIMIHSFHTFTSLCLLFSPKEKTIFIPYYHHNSGKGTFTRKILFRIFIKTLGNIAIKHAKFIVALTENEKNMLIKDFNKLKNKITVIQTGISDKIKISKPYSEKPKKILYVGRFTENKGTLLTIEIFNELLKDFPNLKLILVGSGPLLKEMRLKIKNLNIERRVIILQNIPDNKLYELYADSDLFLMPSNYETFGIAIAESIASGTPTIAPNVGGIPSYLISGFNGYLVEKENMKEEMINFSKKILGSISLRNKFRENGIKLNNSLSWDKTVEAYLKLIKKLL